MSIYSLHQKVLLILRFLKRKWRTVSYLDVQKLYLLIRPKRFY